MGRWEGVGTWGDRWARRLGAVVVLAGTLASFGGNMVALAATLPVRPSAQLRRSLELGYRLWTPLSERCSLLGLVCLLACWVLAICDRAAGDATRVRSRRSMRFLNLASLVRVRIAFLRPSTGHSYDQIEPILIPVLSQNPQHRVTDPPTARGLGTRD